jgi:hypothetical protein
VATACTQCLAWLLLAVHVQVDACKLGIVRGVHYCEVWMQLLHACLSAHLHGMLSDVAETVRLNLQGMREGKQLHVDGRQ